ncbi:MAG TPA: HEAT repeat domain-containing protein [Polyangia bacterium]|nr:HEAT repeat domain-containing protein [Polyangia bacterium]
MTAAGAAPGGLFGAFTPFPERAAEEFFGRSEEVALLDRLLAGEPRLVVFTGPSGVGKTSLLRAGLTPALARRGVAALILGSYQDLERELVRETSRLGIAPPVPGQDPGDYLGGISRDAKGGLVLVFDHLEEALAPDGTFAGVDLEALAAQVIEEGGPMLRIVLCVEDTAFARIEPLRTALRAKTGARASTALPRLTEPKVAEILERSAVQSGTAFEKGLAAAVAADLCHDGPCRAIDIQVVARAISDLRLGSLRRYRRSGGAAVLPSVWIDRVAADAGGRIARRALIAAATSGSVDAEELDARARDGRDLGAEALATLRARGLMTTQPRGRREVHVLAHPALREVVLQATLADRGRAAVARRTLARRRAAGERLRVPELVEVLRDLRGPQSPEDRAIIRRSLAAFGLRAGLVALAVVLIVVALYADSRRAYTLALDPPVDQPGSLGGSARIVVRLGRRRLSFLNFMPNHPPLGSILADSGYTAAALSRDTVARIASGGATGTLDGAGAAGARNHVPSWLRDVLNGLRPVPRGIAKALLGDPDGVAALKQAFADPAARGEILATLAVIGRGGAGEDEILADALADRSPEIRRRAVQIAAGIDRRADAKTTQGAHASLLRGALADPSLDVRATVLQEGSTLPPAEAAGIVALALRDTDPALRRRAEAETDALALRAPAPALDALLEVLQSPDAGARRSALTLFESIATRSPAASSAALLRVIGNESLPDDVRVAALGILRRSGPPPASLKPVLEKAIRPDASPRLRGAALPLYARLITPDEAEALARADMKGPPASRAASAAIWGALAAVRPEDAAKPLKAMLYDPAPEARVEAARAFGFLRHDGFDLTDKALKDPSPDVERAAIESALTLSAQSPAAVADLLGRAVKTVRPAVRRNVVEALARLGEKQPAAALAPLARAIHDADVPTRVAAANGFCAVARKDGLAASPYLRIAARDDHEEVRSAAAACLADVAAADPKGAARMAAELAEATQPAVRAALARALARMGGAAEVAVPTLVKLIGDPSREVRAGAEQTFTTLAPQFLGTATPARRAEIEHALGTALAAGDVPERQAIVTAAAQAGLWGLLKQAAHDGDDTVRLESVRAAGVHPTGGPNAAAALEILHAAVEDRSDVVRSEAMRLLPGTAAGGGREALPTFEALLRGGDPASRAAAIASIGELPDPGDAGFALLAEAMQSRSEAVRAAAARALGRLASHLPERAGALLEKAVRDPAYDVRSAALPALAIVWSHQQDARSLGRVLVGSDADSTRRFVALEALVALGQRASATAAERSTARAELNRIADDGPALARLAAQIGRSFADRPGTDLHAFIERLFGG